MGVVDSTTFHQMQNLVMAAREVEAAALDKYLETNGDSYLETLNQFSSLTESLGRTRECPWPQVAVGNVCITP